MVQLPPHSEHLKRPSSAAPAARANAPAAAAALAALNALAALAALAAQHREPGVWPERVRRVPSKVRVGYVGCFKASRGRGLAAITAEERRQVEGDVAHEGVRV